ncbi:MAG TPA: glycosyltransferase [Hyphomicrobiales bacterium]|nr:glycosyltransferase [Hyphomicrobiales bacterium]
MLGLAAMISVVIPTCDDEQALFETLAALVPAATDGLVREVIVVDGGSRDGTARIADLTGCQWIDGPRERAPRLDRGAGAARGPWLMFLRPGAVPQPGWVEELRALLAASDGRRRDAFHFRIVRSPAGIVSRLPFGRGGAAALDHGLVIRRELYRALGGVRTLPALEIADLARRIGRRRRHRLAAALVPPAAGRRGNRFRRAVGRGLLALRLPTRMVARLYA